MKRNLLIFLVVAIALGTGYWFGGHNNSESLQATSPTTAGQIYVCPMHSHIAQNHPGTCPICGMDLVPTGKSGAGAQIHVDTATQQKFGVRMATAERSSLALEIHTYATLTPDINTVQRITPTVEGTLVKLYATHPGQYIAAGKPLYDIFSQDLMQIQNEYIDYLKRRNQSYANADETRLRNKQMIDSMREQGPAGLEQVAKSMKQTEEQIVAMLQPMERDGLRLVGRLKAAGFNDTMLQKLSIHLNADQVTTITAQHACTVKEVNAQSGMALSAMTEILSCIEPSRAWLEVVFYPDQANQVHEGETLQVQFTDGTRTKIKLVGLSNITEGTARIIKARMPIKIEDAQQLGGYADVTLLSSPRETLNVPVGSVIRTGHGDYVIQALDNGHFLPQKIEIGIANDDRIEVRNGLEPGDRVVMNGQFLLDAAASIADAAHRYEQSIGPAH